MASAATQFLGDDDAVQQSNTWGGDGGTDDGAVSSQHFQHSDEQAQKPDSSVPANYSASDDSGNDDEAEYDPESIVSGVPDLAQAKAAEPPKPAPQPAPRRPRTAGGFLVGDSDSDSDDEPLTPATAVSTSTPVANGRLAGPVSQNAPVLRSPLHQSTTAQEALGLPSTTKTTTTAASLQYLKKGNGGGQIGAAAATSDAVAATEDPVNMLEARIKEEPRGAMDAWLALISEHRQRANIEGARSVYDRFLDVFPQAADIWVAYIEMETDLSNFQAVETLFSRSLNKVPNVQLWTTYLDYVRRRNDLNDTTGQARQTVSQAYDFVLGKIGLDKDSSKIWQDYIQFLRYGPGTIGGSGWQDQQKMDQLRKAYQRAVCVPLSNVNILWKEYDQFEMGLNRMTGRKFIAERSPSYMSAKSSFTALENVTRGLQRSNLPRLPPFPGFDGEAEFSEQVELWKRWIAWEKTDPLDLKMDEPQALQQRILYTYKQALMALRFWPEMWVDAAEWCFENAITEDGKDLGLEYLKEGMSANPESVLLALKHADRIEATYPVEEGIEAKIARGAAVREPYDQVLDKLYALGTALKEKEKAEMVKIEQNASEQLAAAAAAETKAADEDDDDDDVDDDDDYDADKGSEEARNAIIKSKDEKVSVLRQGIAAQYDLLSKCLTFVWIALARAMRRIQGKGDPKEDCGGMRKVFAQARNRGRLGSEIYVAIAKMEWKCYNDRAGGKIFERGSKLFPEDAYFMIEYIKYLIAHGDNTNSRVVFETCINRLIQSQNLDLIHKAKPLLVYMHKREAEYGDLSRIAELERRMAELYPEDPKLAQFSTRFTTSKFDPIAARITISPASQLRPRLTVMPSIERPPSVALNSPRVTARAPVSPRTQFVQTTSSPKRPLLPDDDDLNPPRKIQRSDQREFQRGESPLKGAAGRRLDQQRRMQGLGPVSSAAPPASLPTMVNFMLGQMPGATQYNGARYNSASLVRIVQTGDFDLGTWEARRGKNGRQSTNAHTRQVSNDHDRYSPVLNGRPQSPYGGDRVRPVAASQTYRHSSLRPESRDTYEPAPPIIYHQQQGLPPPPGYGMPPPGQYATPTTAPGWQPPPQNLPAGYPVPPLPQGYGATPPQFQQPPPQGAPYGGWY